MYVLKVIKWGNFVKQTQPVLVLKYISVQYSPYSKDKQSPVKLCPGIHKTFEWLNPSLNYILSF